ncbi:MAG: hypothetical protein SF053_17820 [Bacteroidia bacterium]|nr:hypothetical protein [Bacteroidia bacterium]
MKSKRLLGVIVLVFWIMPCKSQIGSDCAYIWINPLAELIGESIFPDTTFSFYATDSLPLSPIAISLPDSLGGTRINGYAKVFVEFTDLGGINSIFLYSYELRRKKKIIEQYHSGIDNKNGNEFYGMFEQFIEKKVLELPVTRTVDKLEEGRIYRGYCYLNF